MRRAIKSVAVSAIHHSGVRRGMVAFRRLQAGGRRILILSYHRVVEDFAGELRRSIPGLLISGETLRRHVEEAHAAGYELVPLGEALEVMAGMRFARKDLCVITFDDGYRDVYRHGFPILRRMGVPAVLYLPAALIGTPARFKHDRLFHLLQLLRARGQRPASEALPAEAAALLEPVLEGRTTVPAALDAFIGAHRTQVLDEVIEALERVLGGGAGLLPEQGDLMDWDEVRAMAKAGVEIGAHTLGHRVLTFEDEATIRHELAESKRWIEREVGRKVEHFAYCNGWYSDAIIRALVQEGYRSAVTTEDLPNRMGGDPFTLKRKVLWENFSIGMGGGYSAAMTGCSLDDVFGMLGVHRAVLGKRPDGGAASWAGRPV